MTARLLLIAAAGLVVWRIVVAEARRPRSPEDGCCGCGAREGDVLITSPGGHREGYCWPCVDAWSDDPPLYTAMRVFPGRERGVR